jgi:type IV pilus assembly protein PilA
MKKKNLQSGQGLTEYAVILCLVAVAAIATMGFFGGAIKGKIASLSAAVSGKSLTEVQEGEKMSKDASKKAYDRASKVKSSMKIDENDIFDKK